MELFEKIKRINEDLSNRVKHHKPKQKEEIDTVTREKQISDELQCLNTCIKTHKNEIEHLKCKLTTKTGTDQMLELNTKLLLIKTDNENCAKRIKSLQKNINDSSKILEKYAENKQNEIFVIQVFLFIYLINEF